MTKYSRLVAPSLLCFLSTLFLLAPQKSQAQVNVQVRINSGSSTTTCDDGLFGGNPDPQFRVEVAGQGYTTYPSAGICFTDLPNTQYDETYDCPPYPSTVQVCLRAFEDDGALCIVDETCLVQNCQNFNVPAPGNAATYNLSVGGASAANINFTITTSGAFIGGPNDLICNAIDLGTLASGTTIGNANLSNYNNLCAGNANEPNPGWNDQGVWFTFTTSNTPSATVQIEGYNDPAGAGDLIDMQLALYQSSNNTCTGSMTLIREDFDPIIYSESMEVECLLPNTTYFLLVDGDDNLANFFNGQEGYFGLTVEDDGIQQTPDRICDATNLGSVPDGGSIATPNLSQSNICASDTGDPEPGAWGSDKGVWFLFYAPPSGHVIVEANSDAIFPIGVDAIDLQLAIYDSQDNTCTGNLIDVGSDYDPIIFDEDLEVRCLVAGDPYWLFVDGSGLNVDGIFDVTINDGGDYPAPNDQICDATPMGTPQIGNPATQFLQNNYCANNILEPIPPWGNEQGVWYSFEAPTNGVAEISVEALSSDNIDLQIAVYDSDDMSCTGNLNEIGASYSAILPVFAPFNESLIVDCLEPGRTYYILIDGEAGIITSEWAEGEFDIEIATPPQTPPLGNDDICDAIYVGDPTGGSVTTDVGSSPHSQNNFCATFINEPNPANFDPQQTVWYTFTAPSTGSISIDVDQTGIIGNDEAIDLELAVFESDDNTCNGNFSEVEYDAGLFNWLTFDASIELTCLEPGQTYFLVIDGEEDLLGIDPDLVEGYFDITLTEDPPQPVSPNDEICDATAMGNPFLGSPLAINDENNLCADDDGDPNPDAFGTDQTVWYTFETPATGGPYAVEITATSDFPFFTDAVDLQLAVFSSSDNTCSGAFTEVGSDYDAVDFPPLNETIEVQCLEPGQTYYIMVDGSAINVQGYFDLEITSITANPIAQNDLICDAIDMGQVPIGGNINNGVDYYNFCADIETGEPDPSDFGIDQTVWYTFTTPPYTGAYATSDITISLESDPNNIGNEIDLQVAVYTSSDGTCNGTFSEIGSEYNGIGLFLDEDISMTCLEPNTVYFVQVDGSSTNTEGYFTININDDGQGSTPVNDDVCDNIPLGPVPNGGAINDGVTYNNFCATTEPGEPVPTEFNIDNTVWFSFEAPSSGNATISLNNEGGIDLQVGVYASTDQSCNGVLFEHDSDHDGAGVIFDEDIELTCLIAGNTYYVQVDGNYNGAIIDGDEGDFSIIIADDGGTTAFPYNDSICYAYDFGMITAATQTLTLENNICASIELGEPGFGGYAQQTVWYEFIAPTSGQVEIDLSANDIFGIDSEIYLHSSSNNTCSGNLTEIDMDYDATQLLDEEIVSNCLIPGNTYFIQVDGTTVLGLDGEFTISIVDPVPQYGTGQPGDPEPSNNDCADATTIPVQSESCLIAGGIWSLENYGQPTTTDGSNCSTGNCGDTWYQFTMPATGIVQVQGNDDGVGPGTFGDFSELVVTAYTGTCGNLSQIDCETGAGISTSVDFEVVAAPGEIVLLQVSNAEGDDDDEYFELCVSEKCGSDDCLNGQVMAPNVPYCWDTQTADGEDVSGGAPGYLECGDNSNPDASVYFHFSSDCNGSSVTLSIIDAEIGGSCILGTTPTEGFNISLFEDDTPCDGNPLSLVDCQSWTSCDGQPINWSQSYTTLTPNTDYVLQIDAFSEVLGNGDNNGFVMIQTGTNPVVEATEIQPVSCFGLSDGVATASASNGLPPYTFDWDNGETNATATTLDAGIHSVTVTSVNGCTDSTTVLITEPPILLASATEDMAATCDNASDGSATATASGGTTGYTYDWDNGETTQTATQLSGGNHSITITDNNGCTETTTVTIGAPLSVVATVTADSPTNCNGDSNGSATAAGDGDPSTYTYEWDNTETTATATALDAGVHVVTVTDQIGCTTTLAVTILEPSPLTASTNMLAAANCNGESNGSATVTASGGTNPYSYDWDNGETTQTATSLNAGIHTVLVTDNNGCTTTTNVNITEPDPLLATATMDATTNCNGESNGSATANASGGTNPYSYDWDNGETTQTATSLNAGIHIVLVTDNNGCTTTANVNITEPDILLATAAMDAAANCNGESNGSATATASGGTNPYSYDWDNGETTQNATSLNAGTHTVIVTDNNGCTTTANVNITEPDDLIATATMDATANCNGEPNGSATVNTSGGTNPYSYDWDNGETTQTATSLNAGNHTVLVTDNNGCTTTTNVSITEPDALLATATMDASANCNGESNGSATATASGGTNPYLYNWDNGETTQTATSLNAGTHTVIITDNNGCVITANVSITEPDALLATATMDTPANCNGESNGSATATASGGTNPYSYDWDNGETTQNATSLNAGIHSVIVTDNNGCTTTANVNITEPDALLATATMDATANCNGESNGSATVNTSGGTNPYSYDWDNGETTQTATSLNAGIHTVLVTDNNGCTTTTNVNITEPDLLLATAAMDAAANCTGESNGSATATASGGTNPYSYDWDNGETTQTATSLNAGTHTVIVTDNNGCTITANVNITEPDALIATATMDAAANCTSESNGSATATASGGTNPYLYDWDNGETTQTATSLNAGTHTVIVTDNNACNATANVSITEPDALLATATMDATANCNGDSNGSATANTSGGTNPYSYDWDNGETTQTATSLNAGTHTVIITDNNGCTTTANVNITEPDDLIATATMDATANCNGESNGSATVNTTGGTNPYLYDWDNGETTQTATSLNAGIHTVLVTDNNGCTTTTDVSITEPDLLLAAVTMDAAANCTGESNGSATVNASGGTMPYSYDWDNNETTQTATSLNAGNHTVTITDNNNCTISTNVVITEPATLIATAAINAPANCTGESNGSATATASGGTMPYTYDWDNNETTQTATDLNAGNHSVIITDNNNCTISTNVVITEPIPLVANAAMDVGANCNGESNGSATATVSGGTNPYSYDWDNGETTQTATSLNAGIHTVLVTDNNGCTISTNVAITEPTLLLVTATMDVATNCNGESNGSATATVSGGTAPYSYDWDNGETIQTATGLNAGTHTVLVTDNNGCTNSAAVNITEPTAILAMVDNTSDASCSACTGTAAISISGGIPPYTFNWTNGSSDEDAANLCPGINSVTVTDANGCDFNLDVTVGSSSTLAVIDLIETSGISCNNICDAEATISVSGGNPPYTYAWNDAALQTTATATGLCAGTYVATISDADGCIALGNIQVGEPDLLLATAMTNQNVGCLGGNDGMLSASQLGGTPPFAYSWSNGGTSANIAGLVAGNYSLTVTDANGCKATNNANITEPSLPVSVNINSIANAGCTICTGSATAIPTGGLPPYLFSWSNGSNSPTPTDLCAGINNLTITDANGCSSTSAINMLANTTLIASTTIDQQISCNSLCEGQASVSPSNGVAPYTYLWSDGQTAATATGLCAGNYSTTITGLDGCLVVTQTTLNEPTDLIAATSLNNNVDCAGNSDGSASVSATGGNTPYTYIWDNGETNSTAITLAEGMHQVTITDNNGCTEFASINITAPSDLLVSLDGTTDANCTACDGTANITVNGGQAPYAFNWNNGNTQEDPSDLCSGNQSVTVTDANGCQAILAVSIGNLSTLNIASVTVVNPLACNGDCDGALLVTAAGGTQPYTYNWNDPNGQNGQTASNLCAGLYNVTVQDANGCVTAASIVLAAPSLLASQASNLQDVNCQGGNDGQAVVSVSGGIFPYSYNWDNGETSATATMLPAGPHTVTVTDQAGCSSQSTVTIGEPNNGVIASINNITNAGCTVCNGSATVIASGGSAPYAYLWSNGNTSASPSDLCAGNNSVTITDSNGCTAIENSNIPSNSSLAMTISQDNAVSCNGICDASASINVSGGNPPFSYDWDGGQTAPTATNLCAGSHAATVTDSDGCIFINTITINEPAQLVANTNLDNNISCNGESDGSASIIVSGGTSPYTFAWENGETTQTATNLAEGNNNVTITDINGCNISNNINITAPSTLAVILDGTTDANCTACDGSASITVNGGQAPYSYEWNNGSTLEDPIDLCSGNNDVTITDANGCQFIQAVTVGNVSTLVINSINETNSIACQGECTASATVVAAGGNPPYLYNWNNGQNNSTVNNLCAGNYSVTVIDADGCISVDNITISEPDLLVASALETASVSCTGGGDGQASVSASGGIPPYTYTWDNGETGTSATALIAGNHDITIVDNNGCTSFTAINITEPASLPTITVSGVTASGCTACDGTATANPTGGTPPYTYVWSNGSTSSTPTNLCVGPQSVSITDTNGCMASTTLTIPSTGTLVLVGISSDDASCFAACDGMAAVDISGGTPPYAYTWDDPAMQTSSSIANLCAGNYSVTITDAAGCQEFASTNVSQPNQLSATAQVSSPISCDGASDGAVSVLPVGGSNSYTYNWSNGSTDLSPTGLGTGNYQVTVTDTNGCTTTAAVNLTAPNPIVASISITENISCTGGNDGQATVTVNGGTAPFAINWSNNQSGNTATGLSAGTYSVIIIDSNNCSATATVTLVDPQPLVLEMNVVDALCSGACTGEASIAVSGGSGIYNYQWETGEITASIANLCPGSYGLTVTDSEGCLTTSIAVISQPSSIAISVIEDNAPACFGESDGNITIAVSGGNTPYTYAWNNGGNGAQITDLDAGSYTVTVFDAGGCATIETILLDAAAAITAQPMTEDPVCNGDASGSITIQDDGNGTYAYSLDGVNYQASNVFDGLAADSYTVYVENPAGCNLVLNNIPILEPAPLLVDLGAAIQLELGDSIQLEAAVNSSGTFSYEWTPVDFLSCAFCPNPVSTPMETVSYLVQVTSEEGCSDSDEILIEVDKARNIFIPNVFTPNNDGNNDIFYIFAGKGVAQIRQLHIFDRWGELLFEAQNVPPNDPSFGWDGTFRGKTLNPAVFVYYAEIVFVDGATIQYKGDLTILK